MTVPDLDLAVRSLPFVIPRGSDDQPVFAEPWQAHAFAMVVALQEKGAFTWAEWAAALGAEIAAAGEQPCLDDGSAYYQHWLAAIERLVAAKGLTSDADLAERRAAWARAADATPHGAPILLENDPLTRTA